MNNNVKGPDFDSSNLIVFILKRWKPIFAITAAGAIIAIIASLLITPKFKSTVILYPATSESLAKSVIRDDMGAKGALQFGEEEEVEQLLQILNSDELKNRIIEEFNLLEHYEVDTNSSYPKTQLKQKYNSNISAERTKFMSIRIEVLDKNPEIAAKIANRIAEHANTLINEIKLDRANIALKLLREEYKEKKQETEEIKDSLRIIRKKGINNYESQSEVFNDAYAQALADGRTRGLKKLEEKLAILSEYGGAYESLTTELDILMSRENYLKRKLEEMKIEATSDIPHIFIVDKAVPAEKKAYPVRWLIVVVATFGTFVFSVLVFLILNSLRRNMK